eukprot:EG_transcript_4704
MVKDAAEDVTKPITLADLQVGGARTLPEHIQSWTELSQHVVSHKVRLWQWLDSQHKQQQSPEAQAPLNTPDTSKSALPVSHALLRRKIQRLWMAAPKDRWGHMTEKMFFVFTQCLVRRLMGQTISEEILKRERAANEANGTLDEQDFHATLFDMALLYCTGKSREECMVFLQGCHDCIDAVRVQQPRPNRTVAPHVPHPGPTETQPPPHGVHRGSSLHRPHGGLVPATRARSVSTSIDIPTIIVSCTEKAASNVPPGDADRGAPPSAMSPADGSADSDFPTAGWTATAAPRSPVIGQVGRRSVQRSTSSSLNETPNPIEAPLAVPPVSRAPTPIPRDHPPSGRAISPSAVSPQSSRTATSDSSLTDPTDESASETPSEEVELEVETSEPPGHPTLVKQGSVWYLKPPTSLCPADGQRVRMGGGLPLNDGQFPRRQPVPCAATIEEVAPVVQLKDLAILALLRSADCAAAGDVDCATFLAPTPAPPHTALPPSMPPSSPSPPAPPPDPPPLSTALAPLRLEAIPSPRSPSSAAGADVGAREEEVSAPGPWLHGPWRPRATRSAEATKLLVLSRLHSDTLLPSAVRSTPPAPHPRRRAGSGSSPRPGYPLGCWQPEFQGEVQPGSIEPRQLLALPTGPTDVWAAARLGPDPDGLYKFPREEQSEVCEEGGSGPVDCPISVASELAAIAQRIAEITAAWGAAPSPGPGPGAGVPAESLPSARRNPKSRSP